MFSPYLWIVIMAALVITTIVAAVREGRVRKKAVRSMAPQPQDAASDGMMDGFEEVDDFAAVDESDPFRERPSH